MFNASVFVSRITSDEAIPRAIMFPSPRNKFVSRTDKPTPNNASPTDHINTPKLRKIVFIKPQQPPEFSSVYPAEIAQLSAPFTRLMNKIVKLAQLQEHVEVIVQVRITPFLDINVRPGKRVLVAFGCFIRRVRFCRPLQFIWPHNPRSIKLLSCLLEIALPISGHLNNVGVRNLPGKFPVDNL